MSVKV
jgi:hypothetical protein